MTHQTISEEGSVPIFHWTDGVQFEDMAKDQLRKLATLPFIFNRLIALPDVHAGLGSTVGSVIPTIGAVIPASVGSDLGCGVICFRTSLKLEQLPGGLGELRAAIERAVPHGRTNDGREGDRGSWHNIPDEVSKVWTEMEPEFLRLAKRNQRINHRRAQNQLGTLGSGNHCYELCFDEANNIWLMIHSGSRGVGAAIGSAFVGLAKKEMEEKNINLPDRELAFLTEGTESFQDYIDAASWAQSYAKFNRKLMMEFSICALEKFGLPDFSITKEIDCHHNYVNKEHHFGQDVWVARKGAVRADRGMLGVILGSMGDKSYVVSGKGNPDALNTCSHGSGRKMSRTQAKKQFTIEDHIRATEGVECRKDIGVIDETPGSYKSIDDVMRAQEDLVDIVHSLKQLISIKG